MLDRYGQHDYGRDQRWWIETNRWVAVAVFLLLVVSAGCRNNPNWQKRYDEGQQFLRNGDSDSAISIAQAGFKALHRRDPILSWKFRILNAQGLSRQLKSEESLAVLASAPQNLPDDLLAATNITRSIAVCDLGRTAEGTGLLDQTERLVAHSESLRSQLLYARAECTPSETGGRAATYVENAANLIHGKDGYLEARALTYLGYLLMQDGRYDQAIGIFNRGLEVTDSPWLKQKMLGNLGYCHERLGDWKSAPEYLERAEEIASQVKDSAGDRALWLVDLGQQYFSQLHYAEAEKAWAKALALTRGLNDPSSTVKCLNNLALLALGAGDRVTAERYIDEAKQFQLPEEQRMYLLLTEAKLARLNNDVKLAEQLMQQILASRADTETRYNTQTELGTLYSEQRRVAEAERMFREGIATAEESFSLVASEKFRISFMDQEPFYDRYVSFLVNQKRPLDALSIAERARSRALAGALGLDTEKALRLSSVQSRLRSNNQVVLAYWLSPKESYLWVITSRQMRLLKLAPEMDIVKAIDGYSEEVLDVTKPEDAGLGRKLYQMLVEPAEKYIPKGSQVVIVPHRRLYKLNFETLVSPQPEPHFWIEDVCIQNASFLAVLEHPSQKRPHYAKDLLLMGAPVQASKDFPGLEHAPEEIEKVAAHFPSVKETVIDGPAATPAAYTSSDPHQYRFFHFVTHGTASDANPLDSAIILSPSSDGYKLYARDIIRTKINPELVTISTCYGAGTRQYSGEGLVGLAWAFMRVGAHQVIAALWEVDDAANAELMDQFYSELTHGKTAAAALRDGKLAMLHSQTSRKRPYYWASLQLYTGL